jgi:hypothetical protein
MEKLIAVDNVTVELELPFTLRLPDASYGCRLGAETFTIQLSRIGPAQPNAGTMTATVVLTPATGKIDKGDLHTRISVHFLHDAKGPDEQLVAAQQQQRALRYLNAFLDFYRGFFSDPAIRPLDPAEFFEVRFGSAVRFRVESTQPTGKGKFRIGVTFGDYPLTISAGSLAENEVNRFRAASASECELSLPVSLLMNARSYLSRGNHRLAVVEAGTALDVLIEDVAIKILVSKAVPRADALKQLEPMNTSRIAESTIQAVFDIRGTKQWSEYQSRLRQIRNSVVHDAFQPDKALATEFIDMVQGLRDEMEKAKLI